MKKFIALMFILLIPAFANAEVAENENNNLEIKFSEFCPYRSLVNIDTSKTYILSSKVYWSQRKKGFDQRKGECLSKATTEQQAQCISDMREYEMNLTKQYFRTQQTSTQTYHLPND